MIADPDLDVGAVVAGEAGRTGPWVLRSAAMVRESSGKIQVRGEALDVATVVVDPMTGHGAKGQTEPVAGVVPLGNRLRLDHLRVHRRREEALEA